MLKKGIVIYWEVSTEYLEVDFDNIESSCKQLKSTKEDWHNGTYPDWSVNTKLIKKNNQYHLTLIYSRAENEDICSNSKYKEHAKWGTSTIKNLSKNTSSGKAEWVDANGPNQNFTADWERIDWKKIPSGERKKSSVTKIQREQFRQKLLSADEKCVITGEKTTKEVLEAAHIISVADGGRELKSNGVILRSDIHKLYDANKFTISKTGKINKIHGVSAEYKKLLSGSKINDKTISRIKLALIESQKIKSKKA